MKLVARVAKAAVPVDGTLRVTYPPFDVLIAIVDGRAYAIEDACNHAGASLNEGTLTGSCISCPMHGYLFDVKDGTLIAPKGLCEDQRTFVVREEGDELVVWDPGILAIIG
jgi:nitrite reductase/ring-hydroxylating ferredoxin subunit